MSYIMISLRLEDVLNSFNDFTSPALGPVSDTQYNIRRSQNFRLVSPYVEYYSPDLYTYDLNTHGYRSIEFSGDVEILTVGCSFTFGTGLPFEYTWSQQLQKKIPNKKIATLSWPGHGIQDLVSLLFKYFKTIGNPKMIICNFPDFYRFLFLQKEYNLISRHYIGILENPSLDKKVIKNIKESCPHPFWGLYINYEYILMLEQYCDSNNIKLIWSNWSGQNSQSASAELNADSFFKSRGVQDMNENLKNTFKHYYVDYESEDFYYLFHNCSWNKDGSIKYNGAIEKSLNCHLDEKKECEDFFDLAYDRYIIPEKDINDIEKHLKMSRLEKDKNLNQNSQYLGHFGAHRHIHWAEFYYDIIKEKYPEFI